MSEDRLDDLEQKVEILREVVQNVQEDMDQLAENVESGLGHVEAHAIEQAKQEIAKEYDLTEVDDSGRDTGTFLDEVPTDAYMGEARNDDGRLVSVLRWHFEADDIEQNRHALIQREMAAYAIKRELKNVRDQLLEVADQPDVQTYKEHVRGALDERIKEIEKDLSNE